MFAADAVRCMRRGEGGGDPYWASVLGLWHFDGDLLNEKTQALPYSVIGGTNFASGLFSSAVDCSVSDTGFVEQVSPFPFNADMVITFEGYFKSSGTNRQSLFQLENWIADQGAVTVFTINNTLIIRCVRNLSGSPFTDISIPFVWPSAWCHIAVIFSAGRARVYVDGTVQSDSLIDNTKFFTSVPRIAMLCDHGEAGGGFTAGRYFTGTADEVRVTYGVERYINNFTPPTQPFSEG